MAGGWNSGAAAPRVHAVDDQPLLRADRRQHLALGLDAPARPRGGGARGAGPHGHARLRRPQPALRR
eukprot:610802-Rhodomonas_salina.2